MCKSEIDPNPTLFQFEPRTKCPLPLLSGHVPAGFPSPADDYVENKLDLNEHLIKHPAATFFMKAFGDSMIKAGIQSGDILIIDRALEPKSNHIVVAVINGEFTVKRLVKRDGDWFLYPENPDYQPVKLDAEMQISIWGVVTYVVHATQAVAV